jgi:hypothetical protein
MRDITLSVQEKEYPFFIDLIKKFDFVKVKDEGKKKKSKQEFLDEFKEAIDELNLIKSGKLKGRPFQELLDEL